MRASFVAIAVALLLVSSNASAQRLPGNGLDTHLFRPALDSKGLFAVNGADVMPGGHFSTGLVLDYGHNLLRASPPIVRNAFAGTFHFDYGIADRAIVGLSMPAILMSGPGALDVQAIQHVALQGKVKITDWLAIGAQVGVPVSSAARDGGADPSVWWWPRAIFEKRTEKFRIAFEAGWRGHVASDTQVRLDHGTVRDGSRITYGAGASYRILDPVDVVAETYATYLLSDSAGSLRASNEALGGIKVFVEKNSFLMLGAGPRYTSGFEAADFRATIGFVFEPRLESQQGAGGQDEETMLVDTDGDGIPDSEDACPYVKGPRTNDPHTNGCPPIKEPPPPEPQDFDHDGIPDAEDKCPLQPGPKRPDMPQYHGCPDVGLGPGTIFILKQIHFEVNSARILPESNPILDGVAQVMREHPEITLIEIAGHADERGGEKYNLNLTQARVNSVMNALIARHVEARRVRAKGYGFYCPVLDEHNEEAWKENRRVEFKILKGGPNGEPPQLGCANATAHGVSPDPIPE
jgi:outer membrane protein OmpA-like peptidoglycan-associated protein